MKVRMKVEVSGSRDGRPWPPRGETTDLPDAEAAALCAAGMAEPVTDDQADQAEEAVAPAAEKTAPPAPEAPARPAPEKRPRTRKRSE